MRNFIRKERIDTMRKLINAKRFISAVSIAGLLISGMSGYQVKAQETTSAENHQEETYVPNVNWELYKDVRDVHYLTDDTNYNISISETYGAGISDVYVPGEELRLPAKVEFHEKAYPLTQFIAEDAWHGDVRPYQTIVFPDSVRKIELNYNWPNVTKINIPKSMESLSIQKGEGPKSLQVAPENVQFVVPDSMEHYIFQNNALYSKQSPGTLVYPLNIPEKYTIAEGTTTLIMDCFANTCVWRYVKEITCPASLVTANNGAFADCSKLETVDMGKTEIKVLEPGIFTRTPSLNKVILPKTLKKMENHAFWKSGISQLSIPAEVSVIGDRAFWNCKKLKKISFEGTKKMPKFVSTEVFKNTPSGIKFYVKNKKMAKQLKKRLKKSGVKKAKIYVGKKKKLLYKNING